MRTNIYVNNNKMAVVASKTTMAAFGVEGENAVNSRMGVKDALQKFIGAGFKYSKDALAAAAMALLDILITDTKMGESEYKKRIKKYNSELKGRAPNKLGSYVFWAHAITDDELEAAVAGAAPDAPAAAAAAAAGAGADSD